MEYPSPEGLVVHGHMFICLFVEDFVLRRKEPLGSSSPLFLDDEIHYLLIPNSFCYHFLRFDVYLIGILCLTGSVISSLWGLWVSLISPVALHFFFESLIFLSFFLSTHPFFSVFFIPDLFCRRCELVVSVLFPHVARLVFKMVWEIFCHRSVAGAIVTW